MTFRALLILTALAALSALPASAAVNGSVRVSLDYTGNQLAGSSGSVFGSPALSSDGNLVAFETAGQSVPEDTNGTSDVLFRDLSDVPVFLMSVALDGRAANNRSYAPSMSADGRFVAFESMATNLIESDGNGMPDIYLRDREQGTTVRVSAANDGADGNGPSSRPSVSADGSAIAFCSRASNLGGEDDNASSDPFVYKTGSGEIVRVAPPEGATGEGCRRVALSADGLVLAYTYTTGSDAGVSQVYQAHLATGESQLISAASGNPGNAASGAESLAMSDDGGTIAFTSRASDLADGDVNEMADVFLWLAEEGSLARVSVATDGSEGDGESGLLGVDLSGDGRYVVYNSSATNFIPNDYNAVSDVFRLDREQNQIRLGSATIEGRAPNGASYSPTISDDGGTVAFVSLASDVSYGDRNRQPDVFLRGGVFPEDAGLSAPPEDADADAEAPLVSRDDDSSIPNEVIYGGIVAAIALLLIGGWFLTGRRGEA